MSDNLDNSLIFTGLPCFSQPKNRFRICPRQDDLPAAIQAAKAAITWRRDPEGRAILWNVNKKQTSHEISSF